MRRALATLLVIFAAVATAAVDARSLAREGQKTQWAPTRNFSSLNARAVFAGESRGATSPYAGEAWETGAGEKDWQYAAGNPTRFTDPDGRDVVIPNPIVAVKSWFQNSATQVQNSGPAQAFAGGVEAVSEPVANYIAWRRSMTFTEYVAWSRAQPETPLIGDMVGGTAKSLDRAGTNWGVGLGECVSGSPRECGRRLTGAVGETALLMSMAKVAPSRATPTEFAQRVGPVLDMTKGADGVWVYRPTTALAPAAETIARIEQAKAMRPKTFAEFLAATTAVNVSQSQFRGVDVYGMAGRVPTGRSGVFAEPNPNKYLYQGPPVQAPGQHLRWEGFSDRDLDWRGTGREFNDALSEAFERTGVPFADFQVERWGKTLEGKSTPVQWGAPGGAEVSVDFGHWNLDRGGNWVTGPDVPHVGWQEPGKGQSGHILLDQVPAGR